MIRKLLAALGLLLLGAIAYLAFAPVPIAPVAWDAPPNPGYSGVHATNTELADLARLDMGEEGPEDIAVRDGLLYASSQTGKILTHDLATGAVREFADTNGIPLGIEFDADGNLLVADAARGLLRIDRDGGVEVLLDTAGGQPILYADDVDVGPDGVIYLTDASTKFGAVASGGTLEGSLLEIMEHGSTGRVIAFDPRDASARTVVNGLSFPNGIAVGPDNDLLVNITGEYVTLSIPIAGGEPRVFAGPYPGFPDNINPGPILDGEPTFIVGLVSPRAKALDDLAARPALRKAVQRLPASLRPKATEYTHILILDARGRVTHDLQDPAGGFRQSTGGLIHNGTLYLSSLTEHAVATRPAPRPFN